MPACASVATRRSSSWRSDRSRWLTARTTTRRVDTARPAIGRNFKLLLTFNFTSRRVDQLITMAPGILPVKVTPAYPPRDGAVFGKPGRLELLPARLLPLAQGHPEAEPHPSRSPVGVSGCGLSTMPADTDPYRPRSQTNTVSPGWTRNVIVAPQAVASVA